MDKKLPCSSECNTNVDGIKLHFVLILYLFSMNFSSKTADKNIGNHFIRKIKKYVYVMPVNYWNKKYLHFFEHFPHWMLAWRMNCLLCGFAEDSISVAPFDPRNKIEVKTVLLWAPLITWCGPLLLALGRLLNFQGNMFILKSYYLNLKQNNISYITYIPS